MRPAPDFKPVSGSSASERWALSLRATLIVWVLPAAIITAVVVLLSPTPEPKGPVVIELSQTDQTTCDELAGYYKQVANGAVLTEVQRTESTLTGENTYPVKAAYEAYEKAVAAQQDSLADDANEALESARFAYVQACIL